MINLKLINDGGFYACDVNFPVMVKAVCNDPGFDVEGVELIKIGFEFIDPNELYYFSSLENECVECRT